MSSEAEQSIPSRGSHGDEYELPGGPIFSERFKMAHAAWEWCAEKGASVSAPVNIVTALFSLGLVVKQPTLTDEERASVKNFLTVGRLYSHEAVAGALRKLLGESK
jgi:hypothetical protein